MNVLGAPGNHLGCEHETQSTAAAEVTDQDFSNDQPCKFSAIDKRGANISATLATAKERIWHAQVTDNQLAREGPKDQQMTQNAMESTPIMPSAAARFFDALHIPHAHIFARSENPWLGVAVATNPLWFVLPYNVLVYGYLGNYHPVLFPFSLGMVAAGMFHNIVALRLPPHQVNKSRTAMASVQPVMICLSVPCLGSLILSVIPGGRSVPGGNLLVFCALLYICFFFLNYNVRFLRYCSLPAVKLMLYY